MLFNSIEFAVFFVAVFLFYYLVKKNNRLQNCILLISSYIFYACASWKLLSLLVASTIVFYFLGILIGRSEEKAASRLKIVGVLVGVGLLLYFKYLNFFIYSFACLFEAFGLHTNWHLFNVLVPLGISFYTFRLISYVLEVEHRKIEPTRDFVIFANYVAFFPCIFSGPIDRPKQFISQLGEVRKFDYLAVSEGVMQFAWGCFKKIVIADNCAQVVDFVWNLLGYQTGGTLLFTAIIYVFQIYADFSGYSDMAIGAGKMLGISVTKNFDHPLFALSIADYWRRWHMSLTQWLTDYVFVPLNFLLRRQGKFGLMVALTVTFILVGLWHGPNWCYVLFGLLQVVWFIPLIISGKFLQTETIVTGKRGFPAAGQIGKILITFMLVVANGILFRAESLGAFLYYVRRIFSPSLLSVPSFQGEVNTCAVISCVYILIFVILEWKSRNDDFVLQGSKNLAHRCLFLVFCVLSIYFLGQDSNWFIYFQY